MTERITTSAKATITIEISGIGTWGPDCLLNQVYKQGVDAAINAIQKLIQDGGSKVNAHFRMVGSPKIEAVIISREVL